MSTHSCYLTVKTHELTVRAQQVTSPQQLLPSASKAVPLAVHVNACTLTLIRAASTRYAVLLRLMTVLDSIRAPTTGALLGAALSLLLACAPETAPSESTAVSAKATASAAGRSGQSGSTVIANTALAGASFPRGAAGAGVGVGVAGVGQSASTTASTGSLAGAAAPQSAPVKQGPATALASIALFERATQAGAGTGGSFATSAGSTAAASGIGGPGAREADPRRRTDEAPAPELCARVQQAVQSNGGVPTTDRRIQSILAACAAAQQASAGSSATDGGSSGVTSAQAPNGPSPTAALEGTAVFTLATDGVELLIVLDGCRDGAAYPVHIHEGRSCASPLTIGAYWDRPRGEDIPDLRCNGSHVAATYTRFDSASKHWSLGGADASNVIGRALVINDPADRTLPIACGIIEAP